MQHVYGKFDLREKFIPEFWKGQSISTVVRVVMKCSLNVEMARLVAFAQWLCGGTSWMLIALDQM